MTNEEIVRAKNAAYEFFRYYDDPSWADFQEKQAKEKADGNVTALEVIVFELLNAVKPFKSYWMEEVK